MRKRPRGRNVEDEIGCPKKEKAGGRTECNQKTWGGSVARNSLQRGLGKKPPLPSWRSFRVRNLENGLWQSVSPAQEEEEMAINFYYKASTEGGNLKRGGKDFLRLRSEKNTCLTLTCPRRRSVKNSLQKRETGK